MENADEIESVGFDPIESLELLIWIHYESYPTLCLIHHPDHFFSPSLIASQYAASFERRVFIYVGDHLLQQRFI